MIHDGSILVTRTKIKNREVNEITKDHHNNNTEVLMDVHLKCSMWVLLGSLFVLLWQEFRLWFDVEDAARFDVYKNKHLK